MKPSVEIDVKNYSRASTWRTAVFVALRMAIGWHFLYEGLDKLIGAEWSSKAYLEQSSWFMSGVFHRIAADESLLLVVDLLNIWGLVLIGAALMSGVLSRPACVFGAVMLALYYIANPPLPSLGSGAGAEGNYVIVNKNLIEFLSLAVLCALPTAHAWGLGALAKALVRSRRSLGPANAAPTPNEPAAKVARRELLKHLTTLPVAGGFVWAFLKRRGWESHEETILAEEVDGVSAATLKSYEFKGLEALEGQAPKGRIGNLELSRMLLGGNLIGGWAHARDLIYVSKLVKAYHNDQKVFETFYLAEQCGINTILTNPKLCRVINEYWKRDIGKIQFISDCGYGKDVLEGIKVSIDGGAHACYVQGGIGDRLVERGDFDTLAKALELIRGSGLPAGLGGHWLGTIQACVDKGLKPDFWVKTLHKTDYWSATEEPEKDNIWCLKPEETVEYMESLDQPWIAFKILAAGAIPPKVGLQYAFRGGADFVCVGMYDFQVVENTNTLLATLKDESVKTRKRPWRA